MSDAPLHILLTDPHLRGGGQDRYLTNLAGELLRLGHRVTLGCRPGSILVERAAQVGCELESGFHFRGGLRPRSWLGDLRALQGFVRDKKPDIIHANLSQDHWSSGVANRLMGFPFCLVRTRHNTNPVKDSYANRVLNRRWTDYQIVVCDVVRQTLAAQPTFDPARMCSIHNGVDAEEYTHDPEARRKARSEFGYGDEDIVLGIAARLVADKGHEFLIRAFAKLHETIPALKLLVLGEGPLEDDLKRLAEDLSIDRPKKKILFGGFRRDMPYCIQAIDIGLQPSIGCDTSSFSLKEQMAMEKPVIASDYGGLGEIVTDEAEGFVVPAGTVEPLAEAIQRLATNPALQKEMGLAGRKRVLQEFTVQAFAVRTVQAYRQALEIHKGRRKA